MLHELHSAMLHHVAGRLDSWVPVCLGRFVQYAEIILDCSVVFTQKWTGTGLGNIITVDFEHGLLNLFGNLKGVRCFEF
jgi:hypothetical protein